jgi:branched-chain amino acid transport system ATP-binding protein
MLQIDNIEVLYGGAVLVLKGLSLEVREGEIVALLGANGAGKSTTLKAISGLLRSEGGAIRKGCVRFLGNDTAGESADRMVRNGVFQVMEGRRVFEDLTVEENLYAGAYTRNDRSGCRRDLEMIYDLFPRLRERRRQQAGYLSGGEQQMLAIGRGLMAAPRLLLLDEPSLGIAPLLVLEIFELIRKINREKGTTILLVEQNANVALGIAHRAYIMEGGRVVMDGPAEQLCNSPAVREFYLGFSDEGKTRNYRQMRDALRSRFGGVADANDIYYSAA